MIVKYRRLKENIDLYYQWLYGSENNKYIFHLVQQNSWMCVYLCSVDFYYQEENYNAERCADKLIRVFESSTSIEWHFQKKLVGGTHLLFSNTSLRCPGCRAEVSIKHLFYPTQGHCVISKRWDFISVASHSFLSITYVGAKCYLASPLFVLLVSLFVYITFI